MKYKVQIEIAAMAIMVNLIDENGKINRSSRNYKDVMIPTDPIRPEGIFQAVIEELKQLSDNLPGRTDAIIEIYFKFMVNGWLVLDNNYKSLLPVITGADNRAASYVDALMINGIGGQLQRKSGSPLTSMTPVVVSLWVRNENPDIYAQAGHYLGLIEYFKYRIFNQAIIDEASAARSGFYNISKQIWDPQALALTGITEGQLPVIVPLEKHAEVSTEFLQDTHLKNQVKIIL